VLCCVVVVRSTTQHKTQRAVYFCLGVDVLLCSGAHDTTTVTHNSGFLAFVLCIWSVCVVALVRHRMIRCCPRTQTGVVKLVRHRRRDYVEVISVIRLRRRRDTKRVSGTPIGPSSAVDYSRTTREWNRPRTAYRLHIHRVLDTRRRSTAETAGLSAAVLLRHVLPAAAAAASDGR